jgi:hypothetical protein
VVQLQLRVVVFHQRSRSVQVQVHAFDYQPNISGGEPFLDRTNFHALLAGVAAMPLVRVGGSVLGAH